MSKISNESHNDLIKKLLQKEKNIIRSVSLSSNGIQTENELTVTRHHLNDFSSRHEAIIFLHNADLNNVIKEFEHGFEVIEVYTI